MSADNKPSKEILEQWHKDPNNWIWGLFYFNPKDKRLLPPKKIMWMGWTINFANPYSILTLGFIIALCSLIGYLAQTF